MRRAVDEVPRFQRTLLSLHDQQRLTLEDEEVLLPGLFVVHGHRDARVQGVEVDPDLLEADVAVFEAAVAAHLVPHPSRVAGIDDEPVGS